MQVLLLICSVWHVLTTNLCIGSEELSRPAAFLWRYQLDDGHWLKTCGELLLKLEVPCHHTYVRVSRDLLLFPTLPDMSAVSRSSRQRPLSLSLQSIYRMHDKSGNIDTADSLLKSA